jgi:hypothetical protein
MVLKWKFLCPIGSGLISETLLAFFGRKRSRFVYDMKNVEEINFGEISS